MNGAVLTDDDLHLLAQGTHYRAYDKLGAHPVSVDQVSGVQFAVAAPGAAAVSVIGDFNAWDPRAHPMRMAGSSGVWQVFIPGVAPTALYKYCIRSADGGVDADKADPFAFAAEVRPRNASRVWNLAEYAWGDERWMRDRGPRHTHQAPISIYEVHLGSWRRGPGERAWLTYRELADQLTSYVLDMQFTHVELLPITEHPLDASWGYQVTGYYAPTSRFGTPDDFRHLVDTLHQAGIGVILDWVPGHFPDDSHGLASFDGTSLYEYDDPREGRHPEWHTQIFDLGHPVVRSFLISNARFWFEHYHVDGLRVDAVASMLYRDYARVDGEWIPNRHGGRENLEAVDFLRVLNEVVYQDFPGVMTIAEESTAWPGVSRPADQGGLGFGFKWNMGWMNDMLSFMARDPLYRSHHINDLTFSLLYAFDENFVLPLSHDEVVHGKRAIVDKMPGDDRHRFANVRLLYGYLYGHPGKKLLFMGNELGSRREWDYDGAIEWDLARAPMHDGLRRWVRDLNQVYRADPRLHALDAESGGFHWVDHADRDACVVSFLRRDRSGPGGLLFVCNFSGVTHRQYRVGAPLDGWWSERLNSDAPCYGGSGGGNLGRVQARQEPWHDQPCSFPLTLPPLSVLVLEPDAHC